MRSGLVRMLKRQANSFPIRVIKRYGAASGGTWATSIAWNALFAFFPIILAIITILGLFGGSSVGGGLERSIAAAIPGQQGQLLIQALQSFHHAAGALFVVSFVGLLWSGSSLFSAIDQGLDALFPIRQRGFVRQKLMAVTMIVVFTVLVVPAAASASLLSILTKLPGVPTFLTGGPIALLLQIALGVVDGVLLFGAIYYVVPNRKQTLRDVFAGTIVAALLFELFLLAFPLYFKLSHGFTTYGSTFALFFLLMTLAFWMAQIIMLGGAVNAELHPPEPGSFPRAGSSIAPDAQAQADDAAHDSPRQLQHAGASKQ